MKGDLIEAEELFENRSKVRIFDCSWYPVPRDCIGEYHKEHIEGALFFDINKIADLDKKITVNGTSSVLPHMFPTKEFFEESMSEFGVSEKDWVVVYDTMGVFASARVWYTFRLMGHKMVSVLNGGLNAWKSKGYPLTTQIPSFPKSSYKTNNPNFQLVKDYNQILQNINNKEYLVVDARPPRRYQGLDDEPRPCLLKGHVPHSINVCFNELYSTVKEGKEELSVTRLKKKEELEKVFKEKGVEVGREKKVINYCGSGVSASIVSFALHLLGKDIDSQNNCVYDGSFAEYGNIPSSPLEKN